LIVINNIIRTTMPNSYFRRNRFMDLNEEGQVDFLVFPACVTVMGFPRGVTVCASAWRNSTPYPVRCGRKDGRRTAGECVLAS
jgi:hypothetical protein